MSLFIWVLLGISAGVLRAITQKSALRTITPLDFLTIRGLFIIVISLFFIPFVDFRLPWYVYLFCAGIAALASVAFLFRNTALKFADISLVSPLGNITPLFVMLMSVIILREIPNMAQLSGILLIVGGVFVLQSGKGIFEPFIMLVRDKYPRFVLMAGLILGVTITLDRLMLTRYVDAISYLFIIWVMVGVIVLSWRVYKHGVRGLGKIIRTDGLNILWPALLTFAIHIFFYKALEIAYASIVSAAFMSQALLTTPLGGKWFNETGLLRKSVSCVLITVGAAIVLLF